jgi:serine/threonine protein kinase
MLSRIEIVHSKDYIHRDIKPDNFLIGMGKKSDMVYIIDFGLAKRFICPKTGLHVERKQKQGVTGTIRYCSLDAHFRFEQSRRDDLESIGFVLIYFLNGGYLPWMEAE